MKIWLSTALVALIGGATLAQETPADVQQPSPDTEQPAAPGRISDDLLTLLAIDAFFAALNDIREVPSIHPNTSAAADQEPPVFGIDGELECAGDEEPFADVFQSKPIDRLDAIAQVHGFQDATHWQRIGGKILAKSAIEAMAAQAGLSEDEMTLTVGDAFEVE